jgi:hypothetical protein
MLRECVIEDLAMFHIAMILQGHRTRIQWFVQVLLAVRKSEETAAYPACTRSAR